MSATQFTLLAGKSVLIAEDDPLLALDYEDCIRASGATVIGPFSTSNEAIGWLSDANVDLALVDHALGDGPSVELQHTLRERGIPFVVLTGYPRVLVRDAENEGNILSKPIDGRELCVALKRMCA